MPWPLSSRTAAKGTGGITIAQMLEYAQHQLALAGIADPRIEADLILGNLLGCSRAELYARFSEDMSEAFLGAFASILARRLAREPLAYITGHIEFYGLKLTVSSATFIPRPETELLVEASLRWARSQPEADHPLKVCDVGTGSGAIALAMATNLPQSVIYASDISPAALALCEANARRLGLIDRIVLLTGHLLEPSPAPVDLIVANLPYIPSSEIDHLAPEIAHYEPREALDGGTDGLHLVAELLAMAPARLSPRGAMFLEIGHGQAAKVLNLAEKHFPRARLHLLHDLADLERIISITLGSSTA